MLGSAMDATTEDGSEILIRVKYYLDELRAVKTMKVQPWQSAGHVLDSIAHKHYRGKGEAPIEGIGLTKENGEWLPHEKSLEQCGVLNNDLIVFRKKTRQIIVQLPDDSCHEAVVDLSESMQNIVSSIIAQMGMRTLASLDARTKTSDWFDLSRPTYELINLDREILVLGLKTRDAKYLVKDFTFENCSKYEIDVLYVQALKWILEGIVQTSYEDAVALACYQCQESFGDFDPYSHVNGSLRLDDLLSPLWSKSSIIEADIFKRYRKLNGMGSHKCRVSYVSHVFSMGQYRIDYFQGREVKYDDQLHTYGVSCDSIFRIDALTNNVITHFPLKKLKKWKYTRDSDILRLDFGDYEDRLVDIVIENHLDMYETVMKYVNQIAQFKSNETKAGNCFVVGEFPQSVQQSQIVEFIVQARDGHNADKKVGGDEFRVVITNNSLSQSRQGQGITPFCTGRVADLENGSYRCAFSVDSCGEYHCHIILHKVPIASSPFRFTVEPPSNS